MLSIQEPSLTFLKQVSPDGLSLEKWWRDSFSLREKKQSNLPIYEYYEEFPFLKQIIRVKLVNFRTHH